MYTVHPHVRGVYFYSRNRINIPIRFIPTCVGFIDALNQRGRAFIRFIPTCVGFI